MNKNKRIRLLIIFWLIFGIGSPGYGSSKYINLKKIIWIESRGNNMAYNKSSGARGLCQITEICLKEWNNYHKVKYTLNDLWKPEINKEIAEWYLEIRIPQMLRYYKLEVSVRNILISYNAGISYVKYGKKLKKETINYLKQYGL